MPVNTQIWLARKLEKNAFPVRYHMPAPKNGPAYGFLSNPNWKWRPHTMFSSTSMKSFASAMHGSMVQKTSQPDRMMRRMRVKFTPSAPWSFSSSKR